MPYFAPEETPDLVAAAQTATQEISNEDRQFAAAYKAGLNRSAAWTVAGWVPGSILDLADTVGSSVIPGVERQDINNKFLTAVGSPGLAGWFAQNKGAVEVGSGLAGVVVADTVAKKILAPAGLAMQAIRGVPFARRIATLDAQYERAMRLNNITQMEAARRGSVGIERFLGSEMNLARLGAAPLAMSRGQATRALFGAAVAKGLARNITTEAVMATTLHTNGFLYADDLAHNIAWMGAGLGIGAGIDSAVTSYTLRKLANSEAVRQLNRKAYDPTGFETQRLHAFTTADAVLRAAGTDPKDLGFMFQGAGGTTDLITSLAIQTQELRKARGTSERARSLFGKREEIATHQETIAFEELNKVTTRGLRGVGGSGVGTRLEGIGAPLKESLDREPTFLFGIEELGTVPSGMTREETVKLRAENLKQRFDVVQSLLKDGGKIHRTKRMTKDGVQFTDTFVPLAEKEREALIRESQELTFMNSHVPVTMLEPGEWAPISWGKIADGWEPIRPVMEGGLGTDGRAVWTVQRGKTIDERVAIANDGEIFLPAGSKRLDTLQPAEMLDLFTAGRAMVNHHIKTNMVFTVPEKASWFVLDLAEQIAKNGGPELVKYQGNMTRESAQVESFAQKIESINKRVRARRFAKADPLGEEEIFQLRTLLNLPRISAYRAGLMKTTESPVDLLLAGFTGAKAADIRKMSYQDILREFNEANKVSGFDDEIKDRLDGLQGNTFNFLMDRDGNPIKPIIGFKRPLSPLDFSRDELFMREATRAAHLRDSLMGEAADPFTKEISSLLAANPAFSQARKVMELADDQHRSAIPGFRHAAPQSWAGAAMNAITSRERRDIDSQVMRAASQIQEEKTRIVQSLTKSIFDRHMGDMITRLSSAQNARSMMLMNQFLSFRQGWTIARKPTEVTLPSGEKAFAFVLDEENIVNRRRFEQTFGKALEKGQQLLNPDGNPIVLDALAIDALARMQLVHEETFAAKNTLLRSQGLPELKKVPWYAPPPSTKNKYVGYTFDMEDNVVPDMAVIADSPEQLDQMAKELQKSGAWKEGYTFRTRKSVEDFMTLWDKAQMDFIPPNTTAIQPKKHNFGKSSTGLMNTMAFQEALVTMRDSLIKHGDDLIDVMFDPVIKSARARAKIARVESAVGSRSATQHSSIYDRFLQNLTGRTSLSAKDSFMGDVYEWLEQRANGFLSSKPVMDTASAAKRGGAHAAATMRMFKDFVRGAKPGQSLQGEKFNRFSQELGHYMPFKSVNEMIARETQSQTPTEVAEITSKLSWFEAASRLRWFESMHAVVNLGSMVANMPAVIRALQPMAGETVKEAAERNGSLAMTLAVPENGEIVLPNVMRLIHDSYKDAWQKVPDEFTQKAIRLGYMDQEVAEFQRQWGAIDSKAGWRGFMFGDEGATGTGLVAKIKRSGGIDKWLGVLSDKSEAFSRQWGMYAGRRVAKAIGIDGVDAQLNFAHELTNKLIANYDPRNRAEVFQGALGAPIGLFQSYVVNYYQRLFRYLETGNTHALATQYATQAAIFGTSSVPGWNALNWAFFDQGQAKGQDPVESMEARYGKPTADWLMHGTLSNLPKIFGQDGVSLYTRGDSEFRMPVVNLPVADTVERVVKGIGQGLAAFKQDNHTVGMNQLAEIASNMITNRPIAGMIESIGAHGYDTTWDGQVVAESKTAADYLYRALGVRSMTQQKEMEAFYANKNSREEQAARQDILRSSARAAIRNGDFQEVPKIFADYVEKGGDPRFYSRYVKESFKAALDTRGERQLEEALKDPNNRSNAYIARLLDAGIDVEEDENSTDDYGREEQIKNLIDQGWQEVPEPGAEVLQPTPTTNTPLGF